MAATHENGKITVTQGSVTDKAHQICKNAGVVLEAARSSLEKVVKVTVRIEGA
jgi:enamine deaminase RidA (YjgF/YER057c/UK114 family)